jgi:hypothetical protein
LQLPGPAALSGAAPTDVAFVISGDTVFDGLPHGIALAHDFWKESSSLQLAAPISISLRFLRTRPRSGCSNGWRACPEAVASQPWQMV